MNDRRLKLAALVCLAAVIVHGADHVRRDIAFNHGSVFDSYVSPWVRDAGVVQFALVVVAVVLVFRRHRTAAIAAVAVGLPSAALFIVAHLVPHFGAFSDSYVGSQRGAGVNAFSWLTAVFEISADLAFAAAGAAVLRARGLSSVAAPRRDLEGSIAR